MMRSITRRLALSLGVTATAIFLVTLGIVIWLDAAREQEQTYCQTAAAYPQSRYGRRSRPRADYPFCWPQGAEIP
jgi:hypothetical protein